MIYSLSTREWLASPNGGVLGAFNPIADVVPVFVGPQGLDMFSLPCG
jgi:hypothetical protein